MRINRNNYEAYFVDYLEGNLDEHLVDEFIEFIKLNPDLKEELDLFESVSAVPEHISFNKKQALYKEKYDSEKEFDTAAIAQIEGDLSEKDNADFEGYLSSHPEKKKEILLFGKTILKPDFSIVFTQKEKLYKRGLKRTLLLWTSSAAAVLILALAIFSLEKNPDEPILSENTITEIEKGDGIEDTKPVEKEIKTVPVEDKKKEPIKKKETEAKPDVKKTIPKKENKKSIRETTKGRVEHDDIAMRVPHEIPSELKAITASIEVPVYTASMATMTLVFPEYYDDEWLLADQVKEKISLKRFSRAGLNLFTSLSNERFSYQTNKKGKVTEYKYDSRLLAFSIPGKKAQPE